MVTTPKVNATVSVGTLKTPADRLKKHTEKFSAQDSSQSAPTGETYQTFSVTALSSFFLDDAPQHPPKQKAVVYGNDLLDQLDIIRKGLIAGKIPKEDLLQLVRILDNRPQLTIDRELETLIREIETRAAVELAKLGV